MTVYLTSWPPPRVILVRELADAGGYPCTYAPGAVPAARKEARGRNRSLSAWIGGLVQDAVATDWPRSFVDLLHRGAGDLVEPDDPPPEDIEPLR